MTTLSGKRRGAIVGAALVICTATGGLWAGSAPSTSTQPEAGSCAPVFAGRAGVLPCVNRNDPQDKAVRKFVGTTITGCVVGFLGKGGPWGCLYGGIGGAASNIPWSDLG